MSFQAFKDYLQKIESHVSTYTDVQCQVLQGFFYSICADLLAEEELPVRDIDHILTYAGPSFLKHYRVDCHIFHADWAHLTALIPEECPTDTVESTGFEFESWFNTHIPAPHNSVFTRLADGEDVVVESNMKKIVKPLGQIRKTARRRRAPSSPSSLNKKSV